MCRIASLFLLRRLEGSMSPAAGAGNMRQLRLILQFDWGGGGFARSRVRVDRCVSATRAVCLRTS